MDTMFWVWIGAVILFCVAEAITPQLVSIWFVGGSLVALVTNVFGAPEWLQVVLFVAVSALLLIFTKPAVKKFFGSKKVSTNADRVINQTAVVTQTIDNVNGTGLATVMGQSWTARSKNGEMIEEGARVLVESISGVKIIVSRLPSDIRSREEEAAMAN